MPDTLHPCNRCGESKHRRAFYLSSGKVLQPCRACRTSDEYNSERRARRARKPQFITRKCSRCAQNFTFWWEPPAFRAGHGGIRKTCDLCLKHASRASMYKMTGPEVEELLSRPECEICGAPFSTTPQHVDHCHETGVVRGVLCSLCNLAIGYMRDNPSLLESAADYLRRSGHA